MSIGRRNILVGFAGAAAGMLSGARLTGQTPAAFFPPEALAQELTRTPRQTEGPFYPGEKAARPTPHGEVY